MNLVVALVVLLLALSLLALFLALASEPFVGKAYLGVTALALAVAVLPPLLIPFDVFIVSSSPDLQHPQADRRPQRRVLPAAHRAVLPSALWH
jgi:hypothetical protein